jgi:hypothetical protein
MIRVSKVGISIPRGYSGYYVLELLRWNPMLTAKQITDKTIEDSEDLWRPSPRLDLTPFNSDLSYFYLY